MEQIVRTVLFYKYLKDDIMKYKILKEKEPKFSKFPIFWTIEKEDGTEYYITYDIFKNKFVCSCKWNVDTGKECKHIRFIKEYLVKGTEEFEE